MSISWLWDRLIVAKNKKKTCYGVKMNPKFVDVIISRWENYTEKKAVQII